MSNPSGQNPYPPPYGQPPPQGYGGFGQPPPGQPQYPAAPPMPSSGQAPALPGPDPSGGRRGTSRVLPVIVAAGLAVGVCGGLIIVLGTGESDAAAQSTVEDGTGEDGTATDMAAAALDAGTEPIDAAVEIDAPPPEPKIREVTVTFEVEPEDANLRVNGERLRGRTYTFELKEGESKELEIKARASGYRSDELTRTIEGDETIEIELDKRQRRRNSGSSRRKKKKRRDPSKLIDL